MLPMIRAEAHGGQIIPVDRFDPSLVFYAPLWYPYSDMTGSTIKSYDKNRHTGTVTGAAYGKYGRTFYGVDDNINMGNLAIVNFERTDKFSGFAWVSRTAYGAIQSIISKRVNGGLYNGWEMSFKDDNTLRFTLRASNNTMVEVTSVPTFTNANYNFLGFTYNGSSTAAGVILYLNGALIDKNIGTDTLDATTATTDKFSIGARSAAGVFLTGLVGDALIFNRVLSAGEIANLYRATKWRYI